MDITSEYDRTSERPPDVGFSSTDPTKTIALPWVQGLITWLYEQRPNVFADGMMHVWGIEQTRRRSNGRAS